MNLLEWRKHRDKRTWVQRKSQNTLIGELSRYIDSIDNENAAHLQKSFPMEPLFYKGYLCFGITEDIGVLKYLYRYDKGVHWEGVIRAGRMKVFNAFISAKYPLKKGDLLIYAKETIFPEPPISTNITLLYEDNELLVFNKPPRLPCHPSGAYFNNCMVKLLAERGIKCHFIHRLDAETSGVLLAVKTAAAVPIFSHALRTGRKRYRVLSYGAFPPMLKMELPLGRKQGSIVSKKQGRNTLTGKPSVTFFHKDAEYDWEGETYSLLSAYPLTGRTHQVRAHLCESGFAVVGDKIYGRSETYFLNFLEQGLTAALLEKLELPRHFLHAEMLSFSHPVTYKRMVFQATIQNEGDLTAFFTARNWGHIPPPSSEKNLL